jgi:predicted amidohydrolase
MKVAAIQHDIVWEDAAATRAALEPQVHAALAQGVDLIVLTEMFATGFSMHPERIAEPEGGPTESWLVALARHHSVWLLGSIAQHGPDGPADRCVNVAVLAAPDGRTFRYVKRHPFTYAGEHEHYRRGDDLLVVEVAGVRLGLFICYDLRFADDFWALAPEVDAYAVVANWPAARREHWQALVRARAIENQAYVVAVNRVGAAGQQANLAHAGDSAIIDPMGRTLVSAAEQPAVLVADLRPETVRAVRAEFPFLPDRRADRRLP